MRVVKIDVPEVFQVGTIITKRPYAWKGYRKKLLHKFEDLSLEQNKFKNSVASKGTKGGGYLCGKNAHYARYIKKNKSQNESNVVQTDDNIIAIVSKIMA